MRKIAYTYSLIKYLHDPAVGEMLNIGVLLCAPACGFVQAKFNRHYERLSSTFANFDGEQYRNIIAQLEREIRKFDFKDKSETLFVISERAESVDDVIKRICPDRGLSIQFGPMLAGLTDDPEAELFHIFDQSVVSQYPQKEKKGRADDDVWQVYRRPLRERKVEKYLEPKVFVSDSYEFKFEHTFKNENWHVLKPVTMDYAQSQYIQERATRVFGEAAALEGNEEIGTYYILLGAPQLGSHKAAFEKAKNLLGKIPIKKEIIEEDAAEDFANELASYMEEHGVVK